MADRFGRRTGPIAVAIVVGILSGSCGQQGSDPVAGVGPTSSSGPVIEVVDPESEASSPDEGDDGASPPTIGGDAATPSVATQEGDGTPDPAAEDDPASSGSTASPITDTVVAEAAVGSIVVRSSPDTNAAPVATLINPTPTGGPLVFRAVDGGAVGGEWIDVYLPIEPNGSTGWVRRDEVTLSSNPFRIEIDRAAYALRAYRGSDLIVETTVALGTGATPTPVGDFYLLELLAPPDPSGPYGPFAFGLSGFSEVLSEFGGADTAIIGIHGTNDPSSLGTDVSHGCIRLENAVIEELARMLPLGTPVRIT